MNEETFARLKWRHSELICFTSPTTGVTTECLLIAVDFEQGLFRLSPIDTELYDKQLFWSRFEYCERPKKEKKSKLKIV